jgi:hypothetical protein
VFYFPFFVLRSEYEREAKAAASMLTCLLTCSKSVPGSLDALLGPILTLVFARLGRCNTSGLRVKVLSCGLACIYYNPQLAVSFLNSDAAATGTFFNTLFDNFKAMDDDSTQRLVVLSMTALFTLPPAMIPSPVKNNMQSVFMQCIRELVLIEEEAEREDDEEGEEEGEEDEEEDGEL